MRDPTKLNNHVALPVLAVICNVNSMAKDFATTDALHGYMQIEFVQEDRHLTTFITPYSCYFYCCGPMGFAATCVTYYYQGNLALQSVAKCVKLVDDKFPHTTNEFRSSSYAAAHMGSALIEINFL